MLTEDEERWEAELGLVEVDAVMAVGAPQARPEGYYDVTNYCLFCGLRRDTECECEEDTCREP